MHAEAAAAAEAGVVAGKAGPQVWNVFFITFKTGIIFLCQWEWREGHSRPAPKYTQDCLWFVILCFALSQAAVHSCFPLSTAF